MDRATSVGLVTFKAGRSDCSWLMLWRGNARQEFVTKVTDTLPSTLLPSLKAKAFHGNFSYIGSGWDFRLRNILALLLAFRSLIVSQSLWAYSLVSVAFQWLMDKKLALAPRMVVIFFMVMPSSLQGVQFTERGWLSYINIWTALQRCLSLHEPCKELERTGSGAQCLRLAGLNLGHSERQLLLPNLMINHWQVWLALRIRNLCFGKKFGIRKQRVKMLILFRTEIQRISGCGSDFFSIAE